MPLDRGYGDPYFKKKKPKKKPKPRLNSFGESLDTVELDAARDRDRLRTSKPFVSADTAERRVKARTANRRRGAKPSGGPGLAEEREADEALGTAVRKRDVRVLQRNLRKAGYGLKVNGVYGPETEAAFEHHRYVLGEAKSARFSQDLSDAGFARKSLEDVREYGFLGANEMQNFRRRRQSGVNTQEARPWRPPVEPAPFWEDTDRLEGEIDWGALLDAGRSALGGASSFVQDRLRDPKGTALAAGDVKQAAGVGPGMWANPFWRRVAQVIGVSAEEGVRNPSKLYGDLKAIAEGVPQLLGALAASTDDPSILRQLAVAFVDDYRARYGEDWEKHARNDPLFGLLDAVAAGGAVGRVGSVAKGLREGRSLRGAVKNSYRPEEPRLVEDAFGVEARFQHGYSPMTRFFQRQFDRLSERFPEAGPFGANRRVVRRQVKQAKEQTRRELRQHQSLADLVKKPSSFLAIGTRGGDPGRQRLVLEPQFATQGDELLDSLIGFYERELTQPVAKKELAKTKAYISRLMEVERLQRIYDKTVPEERAKIQARLDEAKDRLAATPEEVEAMGHLLDMQQEGRFEGWERRGEMHQAFREAFGDDVARALVAFADRIDETSRDGFYARFKEITQGGEFTPGEGRALFQRAGWREGLVREEGVPGPPAPYELRVVQLAEGNIGSFRFGSAAERQRVQEEVALGGEVHAVIDENDNIIWRTNDRARAIEEAQKANAEAVDSNRIALEEHQRRLERRGSPVFYSKAARVVAEKFPERMKPGSVLNLLRKHGVTDEEIAWTNLTDIERVFLAGERVTREGLLDWIANQGVVLHELHRKNRAGMAPDDPDPDTQPLGGGLMSSTIPEVEAYYDKYYARGALSSRPDDPGYREMILVLPVFDFGPLFFTNHWSDIKNPLLHVRFYELVEPSVQEQPNYTGSRKRILYIDELQSDWHQAGRTEGYRRTYEQLSPAEKEQYNMLGRVLSEDIPRALREVLAPTGLHSLRDVELSYANRKRQLLERAREDNDEYAILRYDQMGLDAGARDGVPASLVVASKIDQDYIEGDPELQKLKRVMEAGREIEDAAYGLAFERSKLVGGENSPNLGPFRGDKWIEVAMKRMLKFAVDEGYDALDWSDGHIHAVRYKQIKGAHVPGNRDTFDPNDFGIFYDEYRVPIKKTSYHQESNGELVEVEFVGDYHDYHDGGAGHLVVRMVDDSEDGMGVVFEGDVDLFGDLPDIPGVDMDDLREILNVNDMSYGPHPDYERALNNARKAWEEAREQNVPWYRNTEDYTPSERKMREGGSPAQWAARPGGQGTVMFYREKIPKAVQKAFASVGLSKPSIRGGSVRGRLQSEANDIGRRTESGYVEDLPFEDLPTLRVELDDLARRVIGEGFPLFHREGGQVRGALEILADEKLRMSLFDSANPLTAVEELGHAFVFDLDADDLGVLEAERGRKLADWTDEDHEWWADVVKRYVYEGEVPGSRALTRILRKLGEWIRALYRTVDEMGAPISDEVRAVLDRRLADPVDPDAGVPPSNATIQRIGAAGSVAKDKFEELEKRHQRRVEKLTADGVKKRLKELLYAYDRVEDPDSERALRLEESIERHRQMLAGLRQVEELEGAAREFRIKKRIEDLKRMKDVKQTDRYVAAKEAVVGLSEWMEEVLRDVFGESAEHLEEVRKGPESLINPDDPQPGRAFMTHRRAVPDRKGAGGVNPGVMVRDVDAKGALNLTKRREMLLMRNAEDLLDPDLLLWRVQQVAALQLQQHFKDMAVARSTPLAEGMVPPAGTYIIKRRGARNRAEFDQLGGDVEELYEFLNNDLNEFLAGVSDGNTPVVSNDYAYVDKSVVDQIIHYAGGKSAERRDRQVGGLLAVADLAAGLSKAAILYTNLGYYPANIVGNMAFLFAHQGPLMMRSLLTAANLRVRNSELFHWISSDMGVGMAASIMDNTHGQGLVGKGLAAERGLASFAGAVADSGPRVAAWVHEARRAGYKSEADWERLLSADHDGGKLDSDRELVQERAQAAMVDFDEMAPFEKDFVRRIVFVYPWMKGSMRWAARYAAEHPERAAVGAVASKEAHELSERNAGDLDLPEWMAGAFVQSVEGKQAKVWNYMSMSPIGTVAEAARLGEGLVDGVRGKDVSRFSTFAGLMQPILMDAFRLLDAQNTFGGTNYIEAGEGFVEDLVLGVSMYRDLSDDGNVSNVYADQDAGAVLLRRYGRLGPYMVSVREAKKQALREKRSEVPATVRQQNEWKQKTQAFADAVYGGAVPTYVRIGNQSKLWTAAQVDALKDKLEVEKLTNTSGAKNSAPGAQTAAVKLAVLRALVKQYPDVMGQARDAVPMIESALKKTKGNPEAIKEVEGIIEDMMFWDELEEFDSIRKEWEKANAAAKG